MTDFLLTTLETELRDELRDASATNYTDRELLAYINEAIRYIQNRIIRLNRRATHVLHESLKVLDKDDFSGGNKIDLPDDYFKHIRFRRVGEELPIKIGSRALFDENVKENRGFIYSSRVGAPQPASGNSGADDLDSLSYAFTHTADLTYTITIAAGGATFDWTDNDTESANGVAITGDPQTVGSYGLTFEFGGTSGYTAGDNWNIDAFATKRIKVLELNFNPTEDMELWYIKRHVPFTLNGTVFSATDYLPYRDFYDAIKMYVILRARNRNEEDIRMDGSLMSPIIELITTVASDINEDDKPNITPKQKSVDIV